MAWIYLAASADSDLPWQIGSHQLPTVKTTDTLNPSFFLEWRLVNCSSLPSGMTLGHLLVNNSLELIVSMEDFHVRTSRQPELVAAWLASEADFIGKSKGLSE